MSLRNLDLSSPQNLLEESSKATAITGDLTLKTSTPGKKPRKGSTRMNACNVEVLTPESQVPVATVKPSTRRKQGNETYSSVSESISLPAFSISNDISGRSVDRSLAQKIIDSRSSNGLDQSRTSRSSTPSLANQSNLSTLSSSSRRKRKSSASSSIQSIDATSFDFTSAMTPKIPREMFVSPLSDDLGNISGVKRILSPHGNSPVSSYEDVSGIKKLLKTPKAQNDLTEVAGVKRIMNPKANSPVSSYIDVKGVKRLLKTPRPHSPLANYASIEGIKELFKHSPVADYTNVAGVKRLYSASVEPNYINVKGVRRIFKETKVPNSPDIAGVEVLFESPKKVMEEYNQSSNPKPIGMVPPMSRQELGVEKIGDSSTETMDNEIERNQLVTTLQVKNTSSLRRRTSATLQIADKQLKSNPSVSLRKGKHTNESLQTVSKAAIQSPGSQKNNSSQINQANVNKMGELKTHRRMLRSKTTVTPQMEDNEQEFTRHKLETEIQMENKGRVTNTRRPGKEKVENENISLNAKSTVGRRTRQTRNQDKTESDEISVFNNKEESSKVKSIIKAKKNNKNQIEPEPSGRSIRGRRNPPKQENTVEAPSSAAKVSILEEQEHDVQSPSNLKKSKIKGVKTTIKGSDSTEAQGSRSRHGKINFTPDVDIEFKTDVGRMRSVRTRGRKANKEKATTAESVAVSIESPSNSENNVKERRGRGQPVQPKAQDTDPKSLEESLKLPKTSSRRRKRDSSVTKLSLEKNNNLGKRDVGSNPDPGLSEPSTSAMIQENNKKTSRRVQFNMCLTVYCISPFSAYSKTTRAESPDSSISSKKGKPSKKVATKTKINPKLKASEKFKSPSSTPVKKEAASRRSMRTKSSPKLETVTKAESPVSRDSPKIRFPVKKGATKTKASSKLKATVKAKSPASTQESPNKGVPAKKVATITKASSKLKATVKSESPAKIASPKRDIPAKKVVTKTKASYKLKATVKRKSSTPVKSPPPKRITRSRK